MDTKLPGGEGVRQPCLVKWSKLFSIDLSTLNTFFDQLISYRTIIQKPCEVVENSKDIFSTLWVGLIYLFETWKYTF